MRKDQLEMLKQLLEKQESERDQALQQQLQKLKDDFSQI